MLLSSCVILSLVSKDSSTSFMQRQCLLHMSFMNHICGLKIISKYSIRSLTFLSLVWCFTGKCTTWESWNLLQPLLAAGLVLIMLEQCRKYFPHVRSVMLQFEVLFKHDGNMAVITKYFCYWFTTIAQVKVFTAVHDPQILYQLFVNDLRSYSGTVRKSSL